MRVSPAFLVRILISAEHKQRDVCTSCRTDCFGNQLLIIRWIAERCTIGKPVATLFRYLATLGINDFDFITNLILYTLKYTDAASGLIAVATEMHLRSI